MNLRILSDEELLRAAANADPLTTSDLQTELVQRFTALIDELEPAQRALAALDDLSVDIADSKDLKLITDLVTLRSEFEHWDIRGLLELLSERDLDNPQALRQVLERDAAMADLLEDLADPIAKLHGLANPTPADAAPATTS